MDGRAVATTLLDKRNLGSLRRSEVGAFRALSGRRNLPEAPGNIPFLRIPPFPGAKIHVFTGEAAAGADGKHLLTLIRTLKVGGSYWAAQPDLPEHYTLVRTFEAIDAARRLSSDPIVFWSDVPQGRDLEDAILVVGECDPWYMLARASAYVRDRKDEQSIIAAALKVPVYEQGSERTLAPVISDAETLLTQALGASYENPFTGQLMPAAAAIELCGFWRQLIDSNRMLAGGLGFAFWKQDHVAPLLWSEGSGFPFLRNARDARRRASLAVWRAKTSSDQLAALNAAGIPLVEVEDGFLRSQGLGADCVPPLSITVDRLGAHFDPSRPSELEQLLEEGKFDAALLDRARRLRELIVAAGLGKYERSTIPIRRPTTDRLQILVPGQVENDRAVICGGCGLTSNLELLARVRAQAPDAHILYKPHPDVLAGHRRGAISEELCLQHANEIVTEGAISALIDAVDEVHVNTSLAGFEALLRGKAVTTYGVPFYAGWGLTCDLGPVPPRRTARRSLDELVAATLLSYPRYIDPVTGLPCPAEVVVERLSGNVGSHWGLLVRVRRFQGRVMRSFRSAVQ